MGCLASCDAQPKSAAEIGAMLGAALAFLPGRSACEASKALLDARCSMLDARCCDAGERQPTVGAEHGPPLLRREIEADPRFGGLNGSMSVRARGQPPTQQTRARVKTRCHPLPMKLGQHSICAHLLGSPKSQPSAATSSHIWPHPSIKCIHYGFLREAEPKLVG